MHGRRSARLAAFAGHRHRVRVAAAAIALALMLGSGCTTTPRVAHIRYQRHEAEKTFGNCTGPTRTNCTRIRLRWPTIAAAPHATAAESIAAFVRARLREAYDGGAPLANEDSVMAGFIEAYRSYAASAVGNPSLPWTFERRIEPLGDTLGVASLAVTESGFLGGAHPNSTTTLANFDLTTGRRLALSDLVLDSGRDELDRIGERAFRRVRKIAHDADLNAAGFWFKDGAFKLNENFAVTPSGLLFFFNAYEVGPYALGATSLRLRWREVMPLIRTDGPLAESQRR